MPVDTTHADYDTAAPDWRIMRDVLGGTRRVKEAGEAYLPKLSEQTPQDYGSYRARALFYNATGRTAESLEGFVFRKDPELIFPDPMRAFMDDATLTGVSFYDHARATVREVLAVGRRGTLVDYAEAEMRPRLVPYEAEAIRNWKTERVAGGMALTMLVLHEWDSEWIPLDAAATKRGQPDEYEQGRFEQWRVYRLVTDDSGEPFVTCEVFRRKDAKKAEFVMIESKIPTRRGQPLHRIPFIFHGADNGLPEPSRLPLLDMADVNLSHYRTSADLENGRHITGLPTPYAVGFKVDGDMTIGSTTAWVSENAQAKCGFLEFTGQGLGALEKAITEKETQMAALGARMLSPEAKKAEAYDTVAMRSSAETSALMRMTISCTQTLSDVLQWVGWWMGTAAEPEEITDTHSIELNTEFTVATMPPDALNALVAAYQSQAVDFETLAYNLRKGELLPPDRTDEQIRASIEQNPIGMAATVG